MADHSTDKKPFGTAEELLDRLQTHNFPAAKNAALVVVSLAALPTETASRSLWASLHNIILAFQERHRAIAFDLSQTEKAALVRVTDTNQIGLVADLKFALLRLIQEYFPDSFGMVDQTRLLRLLHLPARLPQAIRFVESIIAAKGKAAEADQKLHRLDENDIHRVQEVFYRAGAEAFVKAFVRGQPQAALNGDGHSLKRGPRELFVSIDKLRRHILPNTELRGSGNTFNQLTLALDRMLLEGFRQLNGGGRACSLNLNVETVFTREFETFLKKTMNKDLRGVAFEFRQGNILQNYDEFEVARRLILSHGGTVLVDSIFPDSVGIVNIGRIEAGRAKIFWRPGAETIIPAHADDIRILQESGVDLTLARCDDETAVAIGRQVGIRAFQGFYIDDLIAARSRQASADSASATQ